MTALRWRPGARSLATAQRRGGGNVSAYEVDESEPADEAGHRESDQALFMLPLRLTLEVCAAVNAARDAADQPADPAAVTAADVLAGAGPRRRGSAGMTDGEAEVAAARAQADQSWAHANATLGALLGDVRRELVARKGDPVDTAAALAVVLGRAWAGRSDAAEFATGVLLAAAVRLVQEGSPDEG